MLPFSRLKFPVHAFIEISAAYFISNTVMMKAIDWTMTKTIQTDETTNHHYKHILSSKHRTTYN